MSDPYHHALSSARKFGGDSQDYLHIHMWFDESKSWMCDMRHRAFRHHAEGIAECIRTFGAVMSNSEGRIIPVRWIGEQHVREDLKHIPTFADWMRQLKRAPWMGPTPDPIVGPDQQVVDLAGYK